MQKSLQTKHHPPPHYSPLHSSKYNSLSLKSSFPFALYYAMSGNSSAPFLILTCKFSHCLLSWLHEIFAFLSQIIAQAHNFMQTKKSSKIGPSFFFANSQHENKNLFNCFCLGRNTHKKCNRCFLGSIFLSICVYKMFSANLSKLSSF